MLDVEGLRKEAEEMGVEGVEEGQAWRELRGVAAGGDGAGGETGLTTS